MAKETKKGEKGLWEEINKGLFEELKSENNEGVDALLDAVSSAAAVGLLYLTSLLGEESAEAEKSSKEDAEKSVSNEEKTHEVRCKCEPIPVSDEVIEKPTTYRERFAKKANSTVWTADTVYSYLKNRLDLIESGKRLEDFVLKKDRIVLENTPVWNVGIDIAVQRLGFDLFNYCVDDSGEFGTLEMLF